MINLKANGRTYTACEPSSMVYAQNPAPAAVSGVVDALNNHLNNVSGTQGCFVRTKFPAAYSPTGRDVWLAGVYVAHARDRNWVDYGYFILSDDAQSSLFWGVMRKESGTDVIKWRKIVTTAV